MYDSPVFCIRNRLLALAYRVLGLTALIWGLVASYPHYVDFYAYIVFFSVEVGIFYAIVLFSSTIANLVDLRHGVRGIAASSVASLGLAAKAYAIVGGIVGFAYMAPKLGFKDPWDYAFYAMLIVIPIIEWVFFENKGKLHFFSSWTWMIYPLFYVIFCWFRAIIWPSAALVGTEMYPLFWMSFNDEFFFLWLFVSGVALYAFFLLIVFFDNLMGGKYRRRY